MADVVKEVFRDLLSSNDKAFTPERKDGDSPSRNLGYGANYTSKIPRFKGLLSLGVEENTNTLVVSAPTFLIGDVMKLIRDVDQTAASHSTKVVTLNGVSTESLRQVLARMPGVTTSTSRGATRGATAAVIPTAARPPLLLDRGIRTARRSAKTAKPAVFRGPARISSRFAKLRESQLAAVAAWRERCRRFAARVLCCRAAEAFLFLLPRWIHERCHAHPRRDRWRQPASRGTTVAAGLQRAPPPGRTEARTRTPRTDAQRQTALVHDAYLRLAGNSSHALPLGERRTSASSVEPGESACFSGRGHFFAAAAEAMRRILVERARQRRRLKHGGGRHARRSRFRLPGDRSSRPPI